MSRVFMDGDDIYLLFSNTLESMRIPQYSLEASDTTFHGIVLGKGVYTLGKIWLDVIFGTPKNFRRSTQVRGGRLDITIPFHHWLCSIRAVPGGATLRVYLTENARAQLCHHCSREL